MRPWGEADANWYNMQCKQTHCQASEIATNRCRHIETFQFVVMTLRSGHALATPLLIKHLGDVFAHNTRGNSTQYAVVSTAHKHALSHTCCLFPSCPYAHLAVPLILPTFSTIALLGKEAYKPPRLPCGRRMPMGCSGICAKF